MGLDLGLVAVKSKIDFSQSDWENAFNDDEELSYGRKTWNIYHILKDLASKDNPEGSKYEVYWISREVYDSFIELIENALNEGCGYKKLKKALDFVEQWKEKSWDDVYEDEKLYKKFRKMWHRVTEFVDAFSDISPTLGYEWDAHVLLSWYDDRKKVRATYNEGKEIYMYASY